MYSILMKKLQEQAAMKEIDISGWPRREIFDFFSGTEHPFFSVSFRLDVSPVREYAKKEGLSFYHCMIWLVTEAVNNVEAFLYTIQNNKVMLLSRREPSFTDLKPGADYFHICTMKAGGNIRQFCLDAKERSRSQKEFIVYSEETLDLIYISALPWLDLTGLTNEGDLHKDDCIPRISWGRYVREGEKLMMGFSFEVNHRFVDGADIGRFAAELEKLMNEL